MKWITPKKYAVTVDARYATVMLWLRQGLIEGATRRELAAGGWFYLVPSDTPKPETKRGLKPKQTDGEPRNKTTGKAAKNVAAKPAKKSRKGSSKKAGQC